MELVPPARSDHAPQSRGARRDVESWTMRMLEYRDMLRGPHLSVHPVRQDTVPTIDEIQEGGSNEYAGL